jgi:GNAT superfamily N-acetyltransferase
VRLRIRPFREADAPRLAEWLDALTYAEDVCTATSLVHQRRMLPAWRRPLWLVAVRGADVVGIGRDDPQLFGHRLGVRRTWVGVHPDHRRRGLGSRLWQEVEAHARRVGGATLRSWAVADAPEGERFLHARAFAETRRERQSWVDPTSIDAGELDRRAAAARARGFRVSTLRALLPAGEPALHRLFLAADEGVPGQPPPPSVAASTFRRAILDNPTLDRDCSTVVLRGDEPLALSWLKGDRELGRYAIEYTATAPAWRGHGLATLAKLSALRLAAHTGVRWVGTANDADNAPMLAINRKLGHQPLPDLVVYERSI